MEISKKEKDDLEKYLNGFRLVFIDDNGNGTPITEEMLQELINNQEENDE